MKSYVICLFINLFVCYVATGQAFAFGDARTTNPPNTTLRVPTIRNIPPLTDTTNAAGNSNTPYTIMASDYYISTLGFFCRKEILLEKAVRFPIKVRLGSVAYTDQMEGKGRGFIPLRVK